MIHRNANILNVSATLLVLLLVVNIGNYFDFGILICEAISAPAEFIQKSDLLLPPSTIELFLCLILLLVVIILTFIWGRSIKYLQEKITLNRFLILLLTAIFLFAPLFVNSNPNFQKDISVRRLKAPLSTSEYVKLLDNKNAVSDLEFIAQEVTREVFNNDFIYFTSIKLNSDSVYIQQNHSVIGKRVSEFKLDESSIAVFSNFHLFGTDHLGRDIYTLIIYAIRLSIFVAVISALLASILGITLGSLAGYYGGILDIVISRISDVFLSIPPIFFILLIIALFGSSIVSVVFVLGLAGWVSLFRIVKSEFLSISSRDFIVSSKLMGLSQIKIFTTDYLPLMLSPLIVNIVFLVANVILAEAILSFLGLGIGIDHVSLGRMLQLGQEYISSAWWLIIIPGIVLLVIILSFNKFAEEIKVLYNPLLEHD